MRLDEVFVSDPFTLVMTLQAGDVSSRVFPQRQNEFAIRKSLVQFAVDCEPRPVFKRFKLLRLPQRFDDLISFHFQREVHVVRPVFEPEAPEAVSERRSTGFRKSDADDFSRSNRSQLNPITAEPILDPGGDHIR